jgi:hypothetical protein
MPRRRPSILIADFDDAVESHLVGKINDLWPPPADPERHDDRIEALRSDLHEAIARVLADHGVRVVESSPGTVARRSAGS